MTIITIRMRKNDGLETKKFFVFSHLGGSVSLPGVWELGHISGRLPDDPGGFTFHMYDSVVWTKLIGLVEDYSRNISVKLLSKFLQ